jgi:predicted Zn-dependent protease
MMLWLFLLAMQFDPALSPKYAEGLKALREQKYTAAVPIFEALTNTRPEVPDYWLGLGTALASANRLTDSLPALERACNVQPQIPMACLTYGRVLHATRRHAEAIQVLERASRHSESALLYATKAAAHEALGQWMEADRAYRAALAENALRPAQSAETQLRYALFLVRRQQAEAALWQFKQVIQKKPHWGAAWLEQARTLASLNRIPEAADSLEQAIAHGERRKDTLLALSELYTALGDRTKADSYRQEAQGPP